MFYKSKRGLPKMHTTITASANRELDTLLEEVCVALQITQTQYEQAVGHYKAVGNWISEDPFLRALDPRTFPQGSMRLQTTVRPWRYMEYDLDLVYMIGRGRQLTPRDIYRRIQKRLRDNKTYRDRLESLPRCLRLTYAGDFHLDILPACPDSTYGRPYLRIPDGGWDGKRTNPEGYAIWFEQQCALQREIKAMRELAPIPPHQPSQYRSVLRRTTQLFKRRRDVVYQDDQDSPASIVLTTLAGNLFRGEDNTTDALVTILSATEAIVDSSEVLSVSNPSNPGEDLTETWTPRQCKRFHSFVSDFQAQIHALMAARGPQLTTTLQTLFGEEIATQAVTAYAKRLDGERRAGRLHAITGTGLLTTQIGRGAVKVGRNENYGT